MVQMRTLGSRAPGPIAVAKSKSSTAWSRFYKLQSAPPIKFKDLAEAVGHHITYNPMPFDVRVDYVKITSDTVLVPITVQLRNRDITFTDKEGVQHGVVNIFGRLTSLSGKVMQTFRRHRGRRCPRRTAGAGNGKLQDLLESRSPASRTATNWMS